MQSSARSEGAARDLHRFGERDCFPPERPALGGWSSGGRNDGAVIASSTPAERLTPRYETVRGPLSRGPSAHGQGKAGTYLSAARAAEKVDPGFRGYNPIAEFGALNSYPSFPRKREPRDFSRLLLGPRFRGDDEMPCPQDFLTASSAGEACDIGCHREPSCFLRGRPDGRPPGRAFRGDEAISGRGSGQTDRCDLCAADGAGQNRRIFTGTRAERWRGASFIGKERRWGGSCWARRWSNGRLARSTAIPS